MLKLLSVLLLCIGSLTAVTYFPDSTIVVAKDVPPGTFINIPLPSAAYYYRVYTTYTKQAQTGFASYIQIKDSNGNSTDLSTLANTILDDFQMTWFKASGPSLTITNNNQIGSTQYAFTIYIVSSYWAQYPVISASLAENKRIYSNNLSILGDGVTILSAEPFFNLYNFDFHTMDVLTIGTNGYDANANDYQIMKIDDPSRAPASIATIASPICTVYKNTAKSSAEFSFIIDRSPTPVYMISNRGFVSIMSPGWLDYGHTFTIDYTQTNVNTTIDYRYNTYMDMTLQVGEVLPGESVHLQVQVNGGGSTFNTTYTVPTKDKLQSYGRVVSLSTSSNNIDHIPRFLLQLR